MKSDKVITWWTDGQYDSETWIFDHVHDVLMVQMWHSSAIHRQNSIADVQCSTAVCWTAVHYLTYKITLVTYWASVALLSCKLCLSPAYYCWMLEDDVYWSIRLSASSNHEPLCDLNSPTYHWIIPSPKINSLQQLHLLTRNTCNYTLKYKSGNTKIIPKMWTVATNK